MSSVLDILFLRSKRKRAAGKLFIIQWFLCALIIGVFSLVLVRGTFVPEEKKFLDYFFKKSPPFKTEAPLSLFEINAETLKTVGSWPWPNDYHIQTIQMLSRWEAAAIVYLHAFEPEEGAAEKEKLWTDMESVSNLYLPAYLNEKQGKKFWIHGMPVLLEPETGEKTWRKIPAWIETQAKGIGYIDLEKEEDGVVRSVRPFLEYDKKAYSHLAREIAQDLNPGEKTDFETNELIRWKGPWRNVFEVHNYADLIRARQTVPSGLIPEFAEQFVKGKICIIGLTPSGLVETEKTPVDLESPPAAVLAQVLENALSGLTVKPIPVLGHVICLIIIGLLSAVCFMALRNTASLLAGLALGGVWFVTAFVIFWQKSIWLYVFHPLLLILTLFVFSTVYYQLLLKREEKQLVDLATRDGLTGLYVIRHFREILNQVAKEAQAAKQPLSLILIDIDNFKPINDTYGHAAGDKVLQKVSKLIHDTFRTGRPIEEADFVARYGGEEFIVMLRKVGLDAAKKVVAERICRIIEAENFDWEGNKIPVTISLGVATLHAEELIPDKMVRRADEALYLAKRTGKNRVCDETDLSSGKA